jgi:hypothetical protein
MGLMQQGAPHTGPGAGLHTLALRGAGGQGACCGWRGCDAGANAQAAAPATATTRLTPQPRALQLHAAAPSPQPQLPPVSLSQTLLYTCAGEGSCRQLMATNCAPFCCASALSPPSTSITVAVLPVPGTPQM